MKPSIIASILALSSLAHAAPDTVDTAFANTAGVIYGDAEGDFGRPSSIFIQPDGKILVGSNEMATRLGTEPDYLQVPLLRFNPDGTVDNTFFADINMEGSGLGIYYDDTGWPEVMGLGLQSDGKIIAGGVMQGMRDGTNTKASRNIVRINPDGTVDTTFQTFGTEPWTFSNNNYINHLFVEPDDKIVIAGGFRGVRDFDGGPLIIRHGIARLNADGTADESFELKPTEFGVPAASLANMRMIVYQAERDNAGNYYIVGEISGVNPVIQVFARLFPEGTRDFSFAPDLSEARWNSVALDRQGRITVTGLIDFNPTVFHRVFPDGSTDPSFNAPSSLFGTMAQPLQIDSAGRLLYESGNLLRRLDVNGAIDPTFNATASWAVWATTPSWNLATTAPDGSIYAGGFFNRVDGENSVKIVRFEGNPTANSFILDAPSLSILENAGTLHLGVTRLGDGVGAASVDFATVNGTAIAGTDFTATSGTITWAAGENGTKYIPITLIDNLVIDGDKTFTVDFTNPTGATLPGAATATITLLDDEALPTIVNQPQSGTVNEAYPFTFTPSVSVRGAATFQWQRDLGDGFENIAGATSVILRLPNAASADAGDYRLVVTTDTGTVTSDPATLTVETPPGSVLPLSISNLSSIIGNVLALATDADGRTLVMGNVGIRRLLADGTIDPTFTVTFTSTTAGSIVVLPDGKLLISGLFSTVNGQSRTGLARLTADGVLDTDFNPAITFGVNAMAVDADGRIYIGGQNNNGLFRYSAAGVFDATFSAPGIGTGSGFNPGAVFSINPQPDGTILVGHRTGAAPFFVRLLGTGAADPSFTTFAVAPTTGSVLQSLVLPDGRIVIVGNLTDRIIILGENGGIDTSFTLSHLPNSIVNGVAHIDGRLVVWGAFTQVGGLSYRGFARFFLDGTLDQSLPLGGGTNNTVNALITDADGNYLIGGVFTTVGPASRNRLANIFAGPPSALFANTQLVLIENEGPASLSVRRLGDPTGAITLDWATADGTGIAGTDYVAASGTVSWADGDGDDKTILIDLIDNELIQPTRTFTVALTNPTGPILAGPPATISIIDDDTPVEFTTQPQPVVVYAGSPITLTAAANSPTEISYQWFINTDEEVAGATAASYSVGAATLANAGTYFLRATNAAGFVDSTSVEVVVLPEPAAVADGFSFGPTLNANPSTVVPLPDGGALIGGSFSQVNSSTARRYLIRVDANGVLDESFSAVPTNSVQTALRLPDGRILIGGDFTQISGINTPRLAMIDESGALDTAFMANLGTGANGTVNTLALTPQGRIVVGGAFTGFNSGSGTGYVTVLNTDGTRDPAFTSLATSTVTAAAVQSDGKILLGGTFTYEGASRFVRVLPTGARDPSFTAALASTPTINRITIREDGTIFLAGQFFISPANRSLLSFTSSGAGPTSEFTGSGGLNLEFLPGTANDRLHLRGSAPGYLWLTSTDTDAANSFNSNLDFNNSVTAMAVESGGAFWAAGAFTQFRGNPAHRVVRLNGIPTNLAITSLPGIVSVKPGETLTLTVGVTSLTTPTFQWYLDGVALADDARISGSNTATLTITGATAADEGAYTLEIITSTATLTTTTIPVYVADAPRVVAMTEDLTELAGKTFILEATVVGAPAMTYAWTRNGSPVNNGGNISGATTTRLVIANSTEADAGTYVLTATNTAGTDTAETVVSILPPPANRNATFTGLASGGNVNDILPISGGRTLVATASGNLTGGLSSTSSTSRLVLIGPDRTITTPIANFTATADAITAMAIGQDEKVILRGGFTSIAGSAAPGLVRLNPDFTIDPTFAPAAPPATATALAVDSQGRVLVGGNFTDYAGTGRNHLVRLLPDGGIDTTFNHTLNGQVRRIKVLENDRILVCSGTSNFLPPNHHAGILNADGSLDVSFPVNNVNDIDTDPAGNIYLALNNSPRIARYLPDGTADSAFAANVPTLNSSVIRVRVQPNGRIALMGAFTSPANRVLRLNPDGSQDNTFIPGTGVSNATTLYSLALDAFGRIWLGGTFTQYQSTTANRIVVLNGDATDLGFVAQPLAFEVDPDGTATFTVEATGSSAISYQWFKNGVELEDIGNISGATTATLTIANAGGGDEAEYSVVITNASGTLESRAVPLVLLGAPEFLSVPAGGSFEIANTRVLAPTVRGASTLNYEWQLDGEALSNNAVYSGVSTAVLTITNPREANGGVFTLIASNSLGDDSADIPVTFFRNPTRIDPDVPVLTSVNSFVSDLILMPDGSRILGGNFTSVGHINGSGTMRGLAFINLDGSVQNNNVQVYQTTSIGGVNALAMDSQGRLYAGGSFTTSTQGTTGTTTVGRLIRATYNEALSRWERDTDFNIGTGATNNVVNKLVVDSSDRILVAGSFTSFNGDNTRQYLVRLLPDGTFDPDFDPAISAAVSHLVELSDGRIIAAGFNFLVRLLPNGSVDPSFTAGDATSIAVLEVFPDGRVLIARTTNPRLVLMEADGTTIPSFPAVDTAFTSGLGTTAIHLRPDGTILLGGVTSYGGQVRNRLLLINEAGEPLGAYDFEGGTSGDVRFIKTARNGNIHVGGAFTTYQGATVPRYVVLNGEPISLAILGQPAGLTLLEPGEDLTLNVDAEGTTALTYKWFRNDVAINDGGTISGAQSASLSITGTSAANSGVYHVEVTNESGTIESLPSRVVVGAPVADTAVPSRTILVGSSITLTPPVFGPGELTYVWTLGGAPLTDGPGIDGSDTPFLTLSNVSLSSSGEYALTVTNAFGSDTTPPGTLTVIENPAGIATGFTGLTIAGQVNAILPLPDGRILIGGTFTSASDGVNTSGARLAVVNPDGTLHPVAGLSADNTVTRLAIDSAGRPLIAGLFENVHSTPRRRVARLTTTLALDTTFDATPVFNSNAATAEDIFEETGGTLIVTGAFTNAQTVPANTAYAVRLTATGAHDNSFTSGASSIVMRGIPQSDGGFIFVGSFQNYGGSPLGAYIVRTFADGSRNDSVIYQTSPGFNFVTATQFPDGSLFATGSGGGTIRFNADGTRDANFPFNGILNVLVFHQDADGRLLTGGTFNTVIQNTTCNRIARTDHAGIIDPLFASGTGFDNAVRAIATMPDGSIWIGGNFGTYNGTPVQRLVRLTGGPSALPPTPVPDPEPFELANGFTPNPGFSSIIYALALATDGGVYAGGAFINFGGEQDVDRLVKILPDGSRDMSFTPHPQLSQINQLIRQPDGKLLAHGSLARHPSALLRFMPNGSLDTAFHANLGTAENGNLNTLDLMPDGRILLGGTFFGWNGTNFPEARHLIRLNADGTFNATESQPDPTGSSFTHVHHLPDGKILLTYIRSDEFQIRGRRLMPDLSRDIPYFISGSTPPIAHVLTAADGNYLYMPSNNSPIRKVNPAGNLIASGESRLHTAMAVQNDGSLLAGSSNGLYRYGLGLESDPSFAVATNSFVRAIAIRPDGRIWIGGSFTELNGQPVPYLALLTGDPADEIESWYAARGIPLGIRGDLDDADSNGVPNLIEYLYQTNPMNPADRPEPNLGTTSGTGTALAALTGDTLDPAATYMIFAFDLPKNTRGLQITPGVSPDLLDFAPPGVQAVEILPPLENGTREIRRFYIDPPVEDLPAGFMRIGVSR